MLLVRGWHFPNEFPTDTAAWSVAEYQRVLKQLAKLRFNHVTVSIESYQPYTHFEFEGVKRSSSMIFEGGPFRVAGDTAGRKAFGGATIFENPSFAGANTYEHRLAAGQRHLRSILDSAHELGMTVSLWLPLGSFPREFAALWPSPETKSRIVGEEFIPRQRELQSDRRLLGLYKAQLRAFIDTYPSVDEISLFVGGNRFFNTENNPLRDFLSEPKILRRADGRDVEIWHQAEHPDLLNVLVQFSPNKQSKLSRPRLTIDLANRTETILPNIWPIGRDYWNAQTKASSVGFSARAWGMGDHDLAAYWLGRASFNQSLTPEQACRELLKPVCGDGVDERVLKAFDLIEQANQLQGSQRELIRETPTRKTFETISNGKEPVPAHWSQIRDNYLNAMNEMYRANTRAREGGRAFTLYFARRFEFAFEYMNCIEAVRKAGIAEQQKDTATQIAELEKAIESLNNALNAMAAVARSNSDRGLIAVLNEYGYRPLKKKLAEAEAAAK